MVSKQSNQGLCGIDSNSADTGFDPKGVTLTQTPFGGQARLNELERLAKTARRVRQIAEQEVAESSISRDVAEQRIATCERTLRRAEDEMARIRSELYRSQQQAGAEAGNYESAEEFELAILLGKAARTEEPSNDDIAALELTPLPKADKKKTQRQEKPAPFREMSREQHKSSDGTGRRLVFALLVTLGAFVGATLTYLALTSAPIKENVQSVATDPIRLIDKLTPGDVDKRQRPPAPIISPAPAKTIPVMEADQQPSDNTTKPAPEPAPESSKAKPNAAALQLRSREAQLANVIKDAERDFESAQIDRPKTLGAKSHTEKPSANPNTASGDRGTVAEIHPAHQPDLERPKPEETSP
jgi:hypothetical protein